MRATNTIHTYAYQKLLVILAASCCGFTTKPQELSLSYTSEWQTDFQTKANWINLLQAETSLNISSGLTARLGTISTCRTNKDHIVSDMLTYSNIEEENIPIALNRFGVSVNKENFSIFAGVGNVNDSFFATQLTSLFTNSSCGIFPTISCNFPIANFPDAAMGLEGRYESENITVNCAVYNGKGHHKFIGNDCVFRIRPSSDGIFNINAVNYSKYDNNYNLGFGVYHGRINGDEDGTQKTFPTEMEEKDKTRFYYWLYTEQKIIQNLSLIAQYSQCPAIRNGCRNFYGIGIAYDARKYDVALYSCYADFTDNPEWASELTFRYDLTSAIYLQTSLHYIRNSNTRGLVGLFRFGITI